MKWTRLWKAGLLLASVAAAAAAAATPIEINRPVRTWEFFDVLGSQAGILGREDGNLEAWVFPLKLCKDFRLEFNVDGRLIPAANVARSIISRAGSFTILYSGDEFQVRQTMVVMPEGAGGLIRLDVDARSPVRITAKFQRDFQLMWPASIGTGYAEWDEGPSAFLFGADGQPFAAVLGSPGSRLIKREFVTNYSKDDESAWDLGLASGRAVRTIAFAGSVKSRAEALQTYKALLSGADQAAAAADKYYNEAYLAQQVQVSLPDRDLEQAYEWSVLSMRKGLINNPLLGAGMTAGFGPSKGTYRPGFGWFFGRDSFWTSLGLTAAGDYAAAKSAIAFISKFQRADGKIPHEIAQSASLVPWFDKLPWAYSSADATELYLIAMQDYMAATNDENFLAEQRPRLDKAVAFMRSTYDEAGFPRNFGVGHGWIEGGPMLPVRTEFYQAGLAVKALEAYEALGGKAPELAKQRKALEDLYWLDSVKRYAFAIGNDGKAVDQPSVLTAVPMWFGLVDETRARQMIEEFATPEHTTDWGMRIISEKNPLYHPAGYHFGSVWPLFTGWAAVAEYRYHAPAQAYANLMANARLALDGSGGHTTEVLSGDYYSPLSTSSSHQIWSAAMVVSPLLRGLFGLAVDGSRIVLTPHLPADWDSFTLRNVSHKLDIAFRRNGEDWELRVENRDQRPVTLRYAPAVAPTATVLDATWNNAPIVPTPLSGSADRHATWDLQVKPGPNRFTVRVRGDFGYKVDHRLPNLGGVSQNLKVVSERWNGDRLTLRLAGRPGSAHEIGLYGTRKVTAVEGAELNRGGHSATVRFAESAAPDYQTTEVTFVLAP